MRGFKRENAEPPWLSISDMMTVLMMLFLLLYISANLTKSQDESHAETLTQKIRQQDSVINNQSLQISRLEYELNSDYRVRSDIQIKLENMISAGEMSYRAEINDDELNLFDVTFANDSYEITKESAEIIIQSFTNYINVIKEHSNSIEKIRIEGHTSSNGGYIYNLELSQNRSREVLVFILTNQKYSEKEWFYSKLVASGRSSSDLVLTNNKNERFYKSRVTSIRGLDEDRQSSRRVTYGVELKSGVDKQKFIEKIGN